jgi:hypothetical protein
MPRYAGSERSLAFRVLGSGCISVRELILCTVEVKINSLVGGIAILYDKLEVRIRKEAFGVDIILDKVSIN